MDKEDRNPAFRQLSDLLWQAQMTSVARRNERERRRVRLVNMGFAALRRRVPPPPPPSLPSATSSADKCRRRMSKVETLRSAIEYIRHLQKMLRCTECEGNERWSVLEQDARRMDIRDEEDDDEDENSLHLDESSWGKESPTQEQPHTSLRMQASMSAPILHHPVPSYCW